MNASLSLAEKTRAALVEGEFLRGDPISGDRYYSREFMQQEWDHMWTRTWQVGAVEAQFPDAGCVVTHEIGKESILMVRDDEGRIRAFYNVCQHRGNRMVECEQTKVRRLVCNYHSWCYGLNGSLLIAKDTDDFPQGNPVGKLGLKELPCETFGGLVWINMDPQAKPLRESLGVVADQLECYPMERMVRVMHMTAEVDCNWKVIQDNFNEAYHVQALHKELATFIDDDYQNTDFEIFNNGHSRMLMKGCLPAAGVKSKKIQEPLASIMRAWKLDPDDFDGRAADARLAVQQQKRKLGAERGYQHYDNLNDDQLTDYYHYTLFPNMSFTMAAESYQILRPQPHPTDPEKCLFDHWFFVIAEEGQTEVETPVGMHPLAPAAHEVFKHGDQSIGFVADQDLSVAIAQQRGLNSRGYSDSYLSGQEARVRRYHEVINDYIAGRV
ncbi:aromatic ring-hydroxylating oxygenase subunit alpha [Halopseudomonas xiamenensis]|uniref:aromatic ring-hydroxylating oxygenase subunit alpha n=1 Tax=Halopseudomonas xiamenensis TaxID=157792 RepID=UPI0016258AC2|nr:aromatic ring-hydroxylating dioxygenase subunit alpha [Halopseudomonas xiamenensis]